MLKKLFLLSTMALMTLGGLSSCNSEKSKVLSLKSEALDSYVKLSADDVEYHISTEDDFVLMVSQKTCSACTIAKKLLRTYISETNNLIYDIELSDYETISTSNKALPEVKNTPTFLFFKGGSLLKKIEGFKNDYDDFKNTFNRYIYSRNLYTLNTYEKVSGNSDWYYVENKSDTTILDKAISSNKDLTVYYSWLICSDCHNFHEKIYTKYINSLNSNSKAYEFEVTYFRSGKPGTKPNEGEDGYDEYMRWLNFATKYGFGEYRDGKIPALINYKEGQVNEYAIFANDSNVIEEDGTFRYDTAYYNEVKEIRASSKAELKAQAEKLEIQLVKNFMDKYIKGAI